MAVDEQLLDHRLAALEAARPWSPRLIARLESRLRDGTDDEVFRINPIRLAETIAADEGEVVDLLLHAAAVHLVRMDWLLLCPVCACVVESFASLTKVTPRFHCTLCHTDFDTRLDDFIAVGFTVAPDLRPIAYHDPDRLAAEAYVFGYCLSADAVVPPHLPGVAPGTPWLDVWRRALTGLRFLEPGETAEVAMQAVPGLLLSFDPLHDAAFALSVEDRPAPEVQRVSLRRTDAGWHPAAARLASGPLILEVTNATFARVVFGIVVQPPGYAHEPLPFRRFLTGRDLLNCQTFRDLFRGELIRRDEGLGVRDVTIVFADMAGSTALYDRLGDLNAFSLVQHHLNGLQRIAAHHRGAIVKTLGDAVMAAFSSPLDAVRAALSMRGAAESSTGAPGPAVALKVGVHRGAGIAVTFNDQLDYFGQTVNIAARLQRLADPGEVCMSEAVSTFPEVEPLLAGFRVVSENARLRGMDRPLPCVRLSSLAT